MILTTNIYENLILNYKDTLSRVRVITGYTSSSFIEEVLLNLELLELEIFIGMVQKGLSLDEYKKLCKLCKKHQNLHIFCQIKGVPTHSKIIQLEVENEWLTFIGSANFSTGGFKKWREIVTKIDDDVSSEFDYQEINSVSILSEDVLGFVIEKEELDDYSKDIKKIDLVSDESSQKTNSTVKIKSGDQESSKNKRNFFKDSHMRVSPYYYKEFKVPLYFDDEPDDLNGLNSEKPKLSLYNIRVDDFFNKTDERFIFHIEGYQCQAKLTDRFQKTLQFNNDLITRLFKEKLGLDYSQRLTKQKLISLNKKYVKIERIEKNEYIINIL